MSHRTIRRWVPLVAVLATLAVGLWGCTESVGRNYRTTSAETGMGQVNVNMGAVGDVQAAVAPATLQCTFDSIRTFPVCPEGCDPAELLTEAAVVDVMALDEANAANLASTALPVGEYENLSLRLSAAVVVTEDGQEIAVQICSEGNSVDVTGLFSVEEDQITEVRVDFDRSSISYDEASGTYVLCPQIDGGGNGDGDDDSSSKSDKDDDDSSSAKDDDSSGKSDKDDDSGSDKSGKSGKSGHSGHSGDSESSKAKAAGGLS